jgi:hypothetical protein
MDMAEITATDPITNDEDLIDSRDVIARIEELSELEAQERRLAELRALETHPGVSDDEAAELASLREQAEKYGVGLDEDQTEELEQLRELAGEASGYAPDWEHGESLIRDSYFETYAEDLASDIGAISRNAQWPLNHIDWEAAANELKIDYTSVSFGGVDYWIR